MHIDAFDTAILLALQTDATLTNAQLGERVHLSASQCWRRRSALERGGLIEGYRAQLNAVALGFDFRAICRVNLAGHGQAAAAAFARFVEGQPEVRGAWSVSGDADYVLEVVTRSLPAYAAFIHDRLLTFPGVGQVRSDIVLMTLKDTRTLPLE